MYSAAIAFARLRRSPTGRSSLTRNAAVNTSPAPVSHTGCVTGAAVHSPERIAAAARMRNDRDDLRRLLKIAL